MNFVILNTNIISDGESTSDFFDVLFELFEEELEKSNIKFNVILFIGKRIQFDCFFKFIDDRYKCYWIGFSPISNEILYDFISIHGYLNKSINFLYDCNHNVKFIKRLNISGGVYSNSVVNYLGEGSHIGRYSQSLSFLSECYLSDYVMFESFNNFIESLNDYIVYDKLIFEIFELRLTYCSYKDLQRNINKAMRNKTINEHIYSRVEINTYRGGRWIGLRSVFDKYLYLSNTGDPQAMLLYCALFINASSYYKNFNSSIVSFICLLRYFEVLASYHLIKKGSIYAKNDGLYFRADESKVKGVGCLVHHLSSKINQDTKFLIFKLIEIRNSSLMGHGFNFPDIKLYDECRGGLASLSSFFLDENDLEFYNECKKYIAFSPKAEVYKNLYL